MAAVGPSPLPIVSSRRPDLLWTVRVRPTTRGVRPSPPAAARCFRTWCWPGSIEPANVVFAALAESSLVEDRIGWSIRKIVRTAAGTVPSRSVPEPTDAPPKTQPLATSTTRSRRSTRSVVRTSLSQVGFHCASADQGFGVRGSRTSRIVIQTVGVIEASGSAASRAFERAWRPGHPAGLAS